MRFDWVGQTARLAARQGYDVRVALAQAGVRGHNGLIDDDHPLGPAEFVLMCVYLINAVEDEMHAATRKPMALGTAAMAVQAMASARTLEAAIETVSKFFTMTGGSCRVELSTTRSYATVSVVAADGLADVASSVEELMAFWLHVQFSFYLGLLLPLARMTTTAVEHPNAGRIHPYLLCPVRTAGVSTLVFPTSYLRRPSQGRILDAPLFDAHMFWLSRHPVSNMMPIATIGSSAVTSSTLLGQLRQSDMTFADCCKSLSMSQCEVSSKLLVEGRTFRQLRRVALIDRALPHLRAGVTAEDLAAALGYSDARSLRRALMQASGLTINELRVERGDGQAVCAGRVLGQLREQLAAMS